MSSSTIRREEHGTSSFVRVLNRPDILVEGIANEEGLMSFHSFALLLAKHALDELVPELHRYVRMAKK